MGDGMIDAIDSEKFEHACRTWERSLG